MVELLNLAVNAHGGMENWQKLKSLTARLVLDGRLCREKGLAGRFDGIAVSVDLRRQHVVLRSEKDDWQSVFTPALITLCRGDGTLLDSRAFPRQAYLSSAQDVSWTALQATYICSYALWTFINVPFLYTGQAFSVEELPPWHEDGQVFRRLQIYFPDAVQEHRREHIAYFDSQGKLWRHDCSSDAGGIVPGACYASGYEIISGIHVAMTRHVYAFSGSGKREAPTLVEVSLSDVRMR